MSSYLIVYERGEDGAWGAHSPDIDGVFALGANRVETEERMRDALHAHLAFLRQHGEPLPEPRTEAGRIAATA